jgi:uroporphyrinogen decarboxylase
MGPYYQVIFTKRAGAGEVPMKTRERFHATCGFERPDRPIRRETIGYFAETLTRWHTEGLPETVIDDVFTGPPYFGFDSMSWLPIVANGSENPGFYPNFEEKVLSRDEQYIIKTDSAGKTVRVMADGRSTIPQELDHPVKTMRDFLDIKGRLDPESPGRFTDVLDIMISMAVALGEDTYTSAVLCGLFGTYRHLMGLVGLSVALKRDPALLKAIAENWVVMHEALITKIRRRCPVDYIYFWEDMSYKNGPMISPGAFREFMTPYYRRLIDSVKADTDIRVFAVDSDGNLDILIPLFWEAGVNMFLPFEVQAGMDIRAVREEHPGLIIWGGLDKRELAKEASDIRRMVDAFVPPMLARGGFIPAIDHVVPPDVPLKNWTAFLEMVREKG